MKVTVKTVINFDGQTSTTTEEKDFDKLPMLVQMELRGSKSHIESDSGIMDSKSFTRKVTYLRQ